jgi:hypothetical protein
MQGFTDHDFYEKGFYRSWVAPHYSYQDMTGLSDTYPFSLLYPFSFEREFMADYGMWARNSWALPYILACVYIVCVHFVGPKLMEKREPIECNLSLRYWNLFLALFSFIGMARTVPHLVLLLWFYGYSGVLCYPAYSSYGMGATGFWTMIFIISKAFEFIDTVFLIIRKKNVNLLHWWHHASVLLYCWDAVMWNAPAGIFFVSMNYFVHTIMYFYYYLMSAPSESSKPCMPGNWQACAPKQDGSVRPLAEPKIKNGAGEAATQRAGRSRSPRPSKLEDGHANPATQEASEAAAERSTTPSNGEKGSAAKPKRKVISWGHIVTKLQILQMILGIIVVLSSIYYRSIYQNCDGSTENLCFAGLIYGSYFVLFAQFYVQRYLKKSSSRKKVD